MALSKSLLLLTITSFFVAGLVPLSGAAEGASQASNVWAPATALGALTSYPQSSLSAVDCQSGNCIGVGHADNGVTTSALVANEVSGRWTQQVLANSTGDTLVALSCQSTTCTAVGTYDNGTNREALIAVEQGGSWTLTPLSTTLSGASDVVPTSVSCAAGSCTMVGYYLDGTTQYSFYGTNAGGSWAEQAITTAPSGSQADQAMGVSCTISACVAVGTYSTLDQTTDATSTHAFWTSSANGWNEEAIANPVQMANASLNSVSCSSSVCSAVGGADNGNAIDGQALVASNNTGTWVAHTLPLASNGLMNTSLNAIDCLGQTCNAVGDTNSSSAQDSVTASNVGSAWSITVLPAGSGVANTDLSGLSCTSASSCVTVGSSFDTSSSQTLSSMSAPRLSISSTPTASARVGVHYSSRLLVGGGSGTLHYQVTSGHLPRGLALNATTGTLTGLPKEAGTFTATILVQCAGIPVQTVSMMLRITVAKKSGVR